MGANDHSSCMAYHFQVIKEKKGGYKKKRKRRKKKRQIECGNCWGKILCNMGENKSDGYIPHMAYVDMRIGGGK